MCSRTSAAFFGLALSLPLIAGSISDQKLVPWVQGKVRKLEPGAADRRFDQIGWASSLSEAIKYGRENRRPVFVFTHDGDVSTGRC